MANAYYAHIPVASPQEASIFADEYAWAILDILRKAGAKGLTAAEVHKNVEKELGTPVSQSKVYSLLRRLYEEEWIHRYYDPEVQAQRNATGLIWGGVFIDEKFDKAVVEKEKNYIKKNLFPSFLSFIKKAMNDLSEDSTTKKWLPSAGSTNLCKRCHESHEADEFFSTLLDVIVGEFLDSDEYKEFLKQNDFAESKEEEE